nr:ABC transporter substrate-binding protein [candidate division Zixibacteria bacterium]
MKSPAKYRLFLPLYLFLIIILFINGIRAESINLAIVYSDSLSTTLRTIKGIHSAISRQYETSVFYELYLAENGANMEQLVLKIKELDPRLILTVGSYATKAISERIPDKPIIFSAVLNPETSGFVKSLSNPGGNITGASLDIPPDIQFKYFKQVISNLKSIGVLYTDETENLIPPAKALASAANLTLYAIKIQSEKDIPNALDSLNSIVDGYWSVADGRIYSPRATRFILLNTLRSAKPFMGFSKNMVESGALFGLDYDYKDIGRQTGKIAIEVLSGKSPASIPVAVPGIIWFHYNEKTAKHIDVKIPDELVAVAKEVYR